MMGLKVCLLSAVDARILLWHFSTSLSSCFCSSTRMSSSSRVYRSAQSAKKSPEWVKRFPAESRKLHFWLLMKRQQSVLCHPRQSLQIFLVKTPAESYRWNWISSWLTAVSLRGPNDAPAHFRIDKNNLISSEKHTGIIRGGSKKHNWELQQSFSLLSFPAHSPRGRARRGWPRLTDGFVTIHFPGQGPLMEHFPLC